MGRRVTVDLDANVAPYNAKILSAAAATKRFAADGRSADLALADIGRTAGRVGLAAAAAGVLAVKSSADFESAFAKIQGLVGVSAMQVEDWKAQVKTLGPQYGKSASEAADALYFISSAGVQGKDAIDALQVSLEASATGLGDVSTIADLTTSAMNAYGSNVLSAANATDVLTTAVRLGKLEPDQLAGSMGRVLPIASALGVSFDQVGAAMASVSLTGTDAAEAATQLRGILNTILRPSAGAAKALGEVGLSAEGLQQELSTKGLYATLQTLVTAFDGNVGATGRVFNNVRALTGVMSLMGSNTDQVKQIFDDMTKSAGSLDTAFGVTSDTVGFKFNQALATLKGDLLDIGDNELPKVAAGFDALNSALGAIPGPAKSVAGDLLGIAAVTGGATWFSAKTIGGVSRMNKSLSDLSATSPRAARGIKGLVGVTAGLGLFAAGITNADHKIGALETTLGGLVAGFAVGGPLGAAIGGTAGLIASLIRPTQDATVAAKDLADAYNTTTAAFSNDAITAVAAKLAPFADAAKAAGLSQADLTAAVIQGGPALQDAQSKVDAYIAGLGGIGGKNYDLASAAGDLSGALNGQNKEVSKAVALAKDHAAAVGVAAAAENHMASATKKSGQAQQLTADQVKALQDAYKKEVAAARGVAQQFIDISKSADDAKVSLDQWIRQMANQAAALENFTANAIKAGKRGIKQGLIDELEKLGPVGALRMKQLANATDSEIGRANRAWKRGQDAVHGYVDATTKVPKQLETHFNADTGKATSDTKRLQALFESMPHSQNTDLKVDNRQALSGVQAVKAALAAVHDKVVMLTVQHNDVRLGAPRAGGGPVAAGQSYIVGEKRPELFVPNVSGRIIPNVPASSISSHSASQDLSGLIAALAGLLQGQGAIGKTAKQRAADEKQIQKALHDFAPKLSQGVAGVTSEVHDFRQAVRQAGHHWTDAMQQQADKLIEAAREHDIGKALKKFDVDVKDGADGVRAEIHDLRSAIRDAGGTWTDQMSSKAHRLTKIANAYDLATQALSDSQASLQNILDQQASYAQQVGQTQSADPFGHGLSGFISTVGGNTSKSSTFLDALKQLASEGLDGQLFKDLAASGDLQTAIQLLATGPSGIAQQEQAYNTMLGTDQALGTFAGGQVFGGQAAAAQATEAAAQARVDTLTTAMENQQKKLDHLIVKWDNLPAHILNSSHDGSYRGTYEGVTDAASGAGRQMARNR